ncbi:flagellar hook-associated protein FlgL [Rhodocyclaceae bacterium SMB388]
MMRVSSNMIYEKGVATIQRQTAELIQTQQQVATGRRILTPADDPIGAARALEVNQSRAINTQFMTNQGYAEDNLRLFENRLVGVGDVLQYVRERSIQAGNASLSPDELAFIASDLRAQFDAMLALANSQDANSEYLFAGYKSQTRPFEGGFGDVSYQGDQGTRTMQVSASRFMPVSLPGSDIFATGASAGSRVTVGETAGIATLSPMGGAPVNDGLRYVVTATADPTVFDVTRLYPGRPPEPVDAADIAYSAGPPAQVAFDGMNFELGGVPVAGESFEVFVASGSLFENVAVFIDALERPGPSGMAGGAVDFALKTLDAGLDNVLRVRAQIGSQLVEVDNLRNVGGDLDVQFAQTLSRLQDVDMAEAISRLTRQQAFLEAAQASFVRVTGLSLFNFIN